MSFACYLHTTPPILSLPEAVVCVAAKGWLREPCDAYNTDSTAPNKGRRGLPPPLGSPPLG